MRHLGNTHEVAPASFESRHNIDGVLAIGGNGRAGKKVLKEGRHPLTASAGGRNGAKKEGGEADTVVTKGITNPIQSTTEEDRMNITTGKGKNQAG